MMLKMFLLKDPRTGKVEEVYDYPDCLASPTIRARNCRLVTREPLRIPILVVPNEYLTEMDGCGTITESVYASFEYLEYLLDDKRETAEEAEYLKRVSQVQSIFAIESAHKRSCKTIFFTGPKAVYKQTFDDNWVWLEHGILCLTNRGIIVT